MRTLAWVLGAAVVIVGVQTFAVAPQDCGNVAQNGGDDVEVGWCYALFLRDSGNATSQMMDTVNFDVMRLTGQHHPWAWTPTTSAPTSAVPAPTLYRIWAVEGNPPVFQPDAALYAQHMTWEQCQGFLQKTREAWDTWHRGGEKTWLGTANRFGDPAARAECRLE